MDNTRISSLAALMILLIGLGIVQLDQAGAIALADSFGDWINEGYQVVAAVLIAFGFVPKKDSDY